MKHLYAISVNDKFDKTLVNDYNPQTFEGLNGKPVVIIKATAIEAFVLAAKLMFTTNEIRTF